MNPAQTCRAILEDARPIPHRNRYDLDEPKPGSYCECRKGRVKAGCVRHDPQERKAA